MQVSVVNSGGLKRHVTVQIPEAEIQEKVDSRLQELSKQVKIKGFRPGRIPMTVIRQRYGRQVRLEIANEAMQVSLQQAIRDEKLRPASAPQVAEIPAGITKGDLQFTAVVEVYPDIATLDVNKLSIERPTAEVMETDVDEMLVTLREQRRSWSPVERVPATGEQVLFEYVAETDAGRVPAHGHQRLAVVLGSSGFGALESALSTLAPGQTTNVELEFPANFRESALAGQKAKVELKVTTVSESRLPEVDEAFVRGFGITDGSTDSLRKEIRANLERELKQATVSLLKVNLIAALVKVMPDLEIPDSIVRQEASSLAARAAAQQGREASSTDGDAFLDKAAGRVRGGLLMGEIARQNSLRLDGGRVRSTIETIAQTYEDPAEVIQLYYGNQQLLSQVENTVLEEQVVDWVMDKAQVTPRNMKFQDVIKAATGANQ